MNGQARNNDLADGYAPLTSSLLARKGEAAPAFDTDAYAEVMNGNEFTAPVSPIFTEGEGYAANPGDEPDRLALKRPPAGAQAAPASEQNVFEYAPEARPKPRRRPKEQPPRFRASPDGAKYASVTFRMARGELQRLRRAARELDMSCLQILLDAVECYLDANEVQPVKNIWAEETPPSEDIS